MKHIAWGDSGGGGGGGVAAHPPSGVLRVCNMGQGGHLLRVCRGICLCLLGYLGFLGQGGKVDGVTIPVPPVACVSLDEGVVLVAYGYLCDTGG